MRQFNSTRYLVGADVECSCIGNLSPEDKQRFPSIVDWMPSDAPPEGKLAFMVAFLQRTSIFEIAFQYGAGGYFSGCWIDSGGLFWMPDTLYLLERRGDIFEEPLPSMSDGQVHYVLVGAREDAFFVHNNSTRGFHVFGNRSGANQHLSDREFVEKIFSLEHLPHVGEDLSVCYVVFQNTRTRMTTVCRMHRDGELGPLTYCPTMLPDGIVKISFEMSAGVREVLERDSEDDHPMAFLG